MKKLPLLCALTYVVSQTPTLAVAYNEDECARLTRGCLARQDTKRDLCLGNTSNAPSCIGSKLGELVTSRAELAPNTAGEDEGPAFLGPRIANRRCLEAFDKHLASALEQSPLTPESIKHLSATLGRCTEEAPSNLYQP